MIKINEASEFKKSLDGNGEAISSIVGGVTDKFENMNGKIKEQVDSAIESARKAGRNVHAYAKENPWQMAGLALAVGLLAGWVMKKKD